MTRRRTGKVRSLRSLSVMLLTVAVIVLAGLLTALILGMRENRRLGQEYVSDTAELYVEQINRDISQINSELVYLLKYYPDIESFPETLHPEETAYYELLADIREQNQILKIRYSEVKFFYVYAQDAGVLVTDSGTVFPESEKSELNRVLMDLLKAQGAQDPQSTHWQMLYTNEEAYIVSWYSRNGKTLGCVIAMETIFQILQAGMEMYEAIPYVLDLEGRVLLPDKEADTWEKVIAAEDNSGQLLTFNLGAVGLIHFYVVPGSGLLERVLNYQAIFVVITIVLLVSMAFIAWNYYEKILTPMRGFVQDLERMDGEVKLHDDGSNHILELEYASSQFKALARRLQVLKIEVYERELKEQKAELEYVQEQVRPHFLLNCLSVIHGMADEKNEREIVQITEVLSDYMRYVMRDSKSQRLVGEELDHIAAYVEMQKLRYGETAFSYEVLLDGDVKECLVPPLLLQTLVENSIVHEISLDRRIDISLYIARENYDEGAQLYISVSDTGDGFSEETLQALASDRPIIYNGRRHVGLQNLRRRLELMYGGRAGITFSNMGESYGAVVEVHLPLEQAAEEAR